MGRRGEMGETKEMRDGDMERQRKRVRGGRETDKQTDRQTGKRTREL